MRKIKYVLLMVAGIALLGGCGKKSPNSTTTTNQEISSEETSMTVIEETSEEVTEETTEGIENETKQVIPEISISKEAKTFYSDDGENLLYEVEEVCVQVDNEGFDELNSALKNKFDGIQEGEYSDAIEGAKEQMEWDEYFSAYDSRQDVRYAQWNNSILSICKYGDEYTGGAHGYYWFEGINFDVNSGKELTLSDILSDKDGFNSKAIEYVQKETYDYYGDEINSNYEENIKKSFEEGTVNWFLTEKSIVIIFNVYELGSYAAGGMQVQLPLQDYSEYVNKEYISGANQIIFSIYGGTKIEDYIELENSTYIETEYDSEDMCDISIKSGESVENLGKYDHLAEAYVIKRLDGRVFVVFTCQHMTDYTDTYVYEVVQDGLKKCFEKGYYSINEKLISTKEIGINVHIDVMGTYRSDAVFKIEENGELVQMDDVFEVKSHSPLVVKKELPVYVDGKKQSIGIGTELDIIGTNNVDEVYFKVIGDDVDGTIKYERKDDEWGLFIDGVSEFEYFEMIFYAG